MRSAKGLFVLVSWVGSLLHALQRFSLLLHSHIADLQATNGALYCKPVNCYDKYGPARSWFNIDNGFCEAPPSPTPRPSPSKGTVAATPSPSNSSAFGLICVHGEVVCGLTACTCACQGGWQTSLSSSGALPLSPSGLGIYCNSSTASLMTAGQASEAVCHNGFECFFVDQLPFALIVLSIVLVCALIGTCCLHRFCCPNFPLWQCLCWPCVRITKSRCCSCLCNSCCLCKDGEADSEEDDGITGIREEKRRRGNRPRAEQRNAGGKSPEPIRRSTMEATTAALFALLGPMLASLQQHNAQPSSDQQSHAFSRRSNRRVSQAEVIAAAARAKSAVPALAMVASLQQQTAYTSPRRWSTGDASLALPSARQAVIAVAPSPRAVPSGVALSKPGLVRKPQAKMAGTIPKSPQGEKGGEKVASEGGGGGGGGGVDAATVTYQNPVFSRPVVARAHSEPRIATGAATPRMSPREERIPIPRYSFLLRAWRGAFGQTAPAPPVAEAAPAPAYSYDQRYGYEEYGRVTSTGDVTAMRATLASNLAEIHAQEMLRDQARAEAREEAAHSHARSEGQQHYDYYYNHG